MSWQFAQNLLISFLFVYLKPRNLKILLVIHWNLYVFQHFSEGVTCMITNIGIIFTSTSEQVLRWDKRWTCSRVRHVRMFLEQPWLRSVVFCVFAGVTWLSIPIFPPAWCLQLHNLKVIQNISSEHFLNMPPTPLYGPSLLPLDIQPKNGGFLSQMDLFALLFDGPVPDPSEHTRHFSRPRVFCHQLESF